jgi:hypothetical protein
MEAAVSTKRLISFRHSAMLWLPVQWVNKNKLGAYGNWRQAGASLCFGCTLAIVAPELWPLLVIYDPKVRTAAADSDVQLVKKEGTTGCANPAQTHHPLCAIRSLM